MNVGIVGLGLIGGSMARAIKEKTEHAVYGFDLSTSAMLAAKMTEAIDGELDSERLSECDIVIVSLYPGATVDYVKTNAAAFKKGAIVIDTCGVKCCVCSELEDFAAENGFVFLGGHPMAGTQFWGFSHSRASLFKGASMIIASKGISDINLLEKIKEFFVSIGFAELIMTTPEKHDKMIAYTSQLAHIVSNAYVKSPSAMDRKGFSAGSYKDMTRVARLNVEMWTELFLDNRDNLANEIDLLTENLKKYSDALKSGDENKLRELLSEGNDTKRHAG